MGTYIHWQKIFIVAVVIFLSAPSAPSAELKEYEIALTKGVYQINTRNYSDAIKYLKRALEIVPGDKKATQYLGIAYSRAEDYKNAKSVLLDALRMSPDNRRIRYELAVVHYKLGETDEAEDQFRGILKDEIDDPLKVGAKKYLRSMPSYRRKVKKFTLNLMAGIENDSNVILEPSVPLTTGNRKNDWRGIFNLFVDWTFYKTNKTTTQAGYEFYQSVHFKLDDFDVHQHSLELSSQAKLTEKFKTHLRYSFNYSLVGRDLYSRIHDLNPSLKYNFSPNLMTELHYTHEFRDFSNSDNFPENSVRSGDYDAVGVTQSIILGRHIAMYIDYTYDEDSTEADFWKYSGHRGMLGFALSFGTWRVFPNITYSEREYSGIFPGFSEKREDEVQEYSIYLIKNLTDKVIISLSELYVNNNSNLESFHYDRNITGLRLEVKL